MVSDTLLIKHLPDSLTNAQKESLMRHFGALEVKCLSSKINKYNIVFAWFPNELYAGKILQLEVKGSCLSVEFARSKESASLPTKPLPEIKNAEEIQNEKDYNNFLEKLNSWHCGVNFKMPVPSHLCYQYPPPDTVVLRNIAKVLATVPKFYTQVLHLMNKMNLPCPFGIEILPHVEIELSEPQHEQEIEEQEVPAAVPSDKEDEESELSSDDEVRKHVEIIPSQRKVKKKTIKVPKFVKPTTKPTTSVSKKKRTRTTFEQVFETLEGADDNKKKAKLSYPTPELLTTRLESKEEGGAAAKSANPVGFGFIHPQRQQEEEKEPVVDTRDEREEERLEKEIRDCITAEALAENRISERDRDILPVFRSYTEGAPTCRLYIKNVAKAVTQEDLRFIYSRYLPDTNTLGAELNMFDIRLMQQSGRMKGQAFVTLQTIELAQQALKETNGYILKDKPLVVQFARSATK